MSINKMPKTKMDYSKCCIYKIEHINDETLVYVGHTTNFNKRKTAHKSNCNNKEVKAFNFRLFKMISDNGGWDAFKMIELEKYPCNDKREAERRENDVMKELKVSMNTMKSYVAEEELKAMKQICDKKYREKNKEKIKEQQKLYREDNEENIAERKKERKNYLYLRL